MLQFAQLTVPLTGPGGTTPALYAAVVDDKPLSLRRIPRSIVVFTGPTPKAPVVFYEIRSESSYRILRRFIDQHPTWEVTTNWSRTRFRWYRSERLNQGLPTFQFRETRQGWLPVAEPRQSTVTPVSAAETRFIPQHSA